VYDRARGDREHPDCNICGLPVYPFDRWEESHVPVPKCFGGTETGVAHTKCNREHGAKVVTPMTAKSDRVRQRYIGAWRSRFPLPGGRDDPRRRKISGEIVNRLTNEPWRLR
jgi:hypothetical protein